jgi:RNA-binding protein 39
MERESTLTKDQRTVFVNQLVQRATERDLSKYLSRKGFAVNEVIMLRDKRTGKHKGCAYVELRQLAQVAPCIETLNDQIPDFQKFPILIKPSEAEKNYAPTISTTTTVVTAPATTLTKTAATATTTALLPFPVDSFGNPILAQKVYVGGLNPTVTHDHLLALFAPFGSLRSVQMQTDAVTKASKGFAFLQFTDPKDANLAIQSMSGQSLAGHALKTGWGNQAMGGACVTSEEFPPDAGPKTQAAYGVLRQLNLGQAVAAVLPTSLTTTTTTNGVAGHGGTVMMSPHKPGTVAEARASLAAVAAAAAANVVPAVAASAAAAISSAVSTAVPIGDPTALQIKNAEHPTPHLLIHNMFDKDQETEVGWEKEIQEEFESEATKYGKLDRCVVMHQQAGGKIYASFASVDAAKTCASSLAGRWFDKRQLRVEFVSEDDVPKE